MFIKDYISKDYPAFNSSDMIDDANEMINVAKENNVKLGVCHQNRFNKSVQKIREAVGVLVQEEVDCIVHIPVPDGRRALQDGKAYRQADDYHRAGGRKYAPGIEVLRHPGLEGRPPPSLGVGHAHEGDLHLFASLLQGSSQLLIHEGGYVPHSIKGSAQRKSISGQDELL